MNEMTLKVIEVDGLLYKAVPELDASEHEWDAHDGNCSGCAFLHIDCEPIRQKIMTEDCANNVADGSDGVIYVPIEIQDIPVIAKQELILQGESNE